MHEDACLRFLNGSGFNTKGADLSIHFADFRFVFWKIHLSLAFASFFHF